MTVAVFGGDGRFRTDTLPGYRVRVYRAPRYGGRGELARLVDALRKGRINHVIILTRWNSHSATRRVRALCRRLDISFEVCP